MLGERPAPEKRSRGGAMGAGAAPDRAKKPSVARCSNSIILAVGRHEGEPAKASPWTAGDACSAAQTSERQILTPANEGAEGVDRN